MISYELMYFLISNDWDIMEKKKLEFENITSIYLRKKFSDIFNLIRPFCSYYFYKNETKIEYISRILLPHEPYVYHQLSFIYKNDIEEIWKKWRLRTNQRNNACYNTINIYN